ncbi:hypothetical protein SUGI_0559180 [Cryptomeria japonica]|nr:hypothetical protein SUGI_0559180 [Cryptomeria japonica]
MFLWLACQRASAAPLLEMMMNLLSSLGAPSQRSKSSPVAQRKVIWKSFSTNRAPYVGRIEEDSPCYFPGSFRKIADQPDLRFPRTRSCRPARTSLGPK